MSKDGYMPSVDGLRAVAVFAVIANHMASNLLPGGFLGVDVFFVISGFVITHSLLAQKDKPAGKVLLAFYARRIKRLLPALVLVVIAGSLAIRLFDPRPLASTVTGAFALVGASNLFLYSEAVDYFGGAAELNMFTHTWSLGVEEQFYLAYPLLFLLTARIGPTFRFAILALLSAVSFVAFVFVAKINQPAAYFLTPFRFWELAFGCMAALAAAHHEPIVAIVRRLPASLAFAAMLIGLTLPETWFVPATMFVVAAATILLLSMTDGSLPHRILSGPAMVYAGRISYSLYLWHWLAICLSVWTIGIHWWSAPFQIALMFALAALSYRYLEAPLRYGPWLGSGLRPIAAGIGLVVFGFAVIGVTHRFNLIAFSGSSAHAAQTATLTPGYVSPRTGRRIDDCQPSVVFDAASGEFRPTPLEACRAGAGSPLLVFIGDSHAMDLFATADIIAAQGLASALNIAQTGCRAPPLPGEASFCHYQPALLKFLEHSDAHPVVVLRNNYSPRSLDGSLGRYVAQIEGLLDQARAAHVRMVYVAPAPKYDLVGPTNLCSVQWFRPVWAIGGRCETDLNVSRSEQLARRREFLDALNRLQRQREDFIVFDPFETLCGSDPKTCSPKRDGRVFYRDQSHLTVEGAEMLAQPLVATLKAKGWLNTP